MTSAEQELRSVIDEPVRAVRAKDPVPLAARQAGDVVTFDVLRPLRSRCNETAEQTTQAWFDSYASDIGYGVQELEVRASGDLGFCSFLYHVTGTLKSGDEVNMWVRATLGLERRDGTWVIFHDHESSPLNPETGQALTDLAP